MEKITDKIAALPKDATYFSLEFFPPKTHMGSSNLQARLARMSQALRPLFVTVTWGAGGSTSQKSLELAEICQRQLGLTTCLHLTCTNMNTSLIDQALDEAKVLGIRNILALRGDPPRGEEYQLEGEANTSQEFQWAIDLVRYIKKTHGDYFCIGVAAYPEGHADESYPEVQDPARDLPYLVEKVQAGADFIMTQLCYDIDIYTKFEKMLRSHPSGAFKSMPILPGLMPIQSYQILTRVTKLSHAHLPSDVMARIDKVKNDDAAVKQVGVDILSEIVQGILKQTHSSPRGLHFYTLNLEKAVAFILERCDLISPSTPEGEENAIDESAVLSTSPPTNNVISAEEEARMLDFQARRRRASSINTQPRNRVVVDRPSVSSVTSHEALDTDAGVPADPTLTSRSTTLAISEGEGALGREATWDDFPNGRWGDARSAAYGTIDGYGISLHVSLSRALELWGKPTKPSDITDLFRRHLTGDLETLPWSEGTLSEETKSIMSQLLRLISDGIWTIASQPTVNGVRSSHPIYGWGPPHGGFVFQKPFVEFFAPASVWTSKLKPRLDARPSDFTYYASGNPDTHNSLEFQCSHPGSTNAVTWGVFAGKEIITPTIVEEVSFRAWIEEAWGIWREWRACFDKGSESQNLIDMISKEWVLCNIIGQKFNEAKGGDLWEVLSG
ncbi:MAG: hypothetical protein M1834_004451 [Cirrosporium novae-zelandiae]|nr:MAG: hypothetical protein M1834_004451 [Cirrosporium novae-zelandiae]